MNPRAEKLVTHLVELAQETGDPEEILNDAMQALAVMACLVAGDEDPNTYSRVQRALAHTLAATLDGETVAL